MKVSVVITTFNRSRQLHRSLYSILELGERKPEEIIVVDDSSSDNTADTVRSYAALHPEVQISYIRYSRPEQGWNNPAKPRNMGIRFTNPDHELIVFTEPEMLLPANTIKVMVEYFENPPEFIPPPPNEPWLPPTKRHEHFFLTASHIGYCLSEAPTDDDRWRDPMQVFSHHHTDRRWPEINTRVAAVLRDDVFKIRGWDERFKVWGYDDTDFMNRLQMSGANHIPLYLPVVHMIHEAPPAGASADQNLALMQQSHRDGNYAPNDETWGTLPVEKKFGTEITHEQWLAIQKDELESWVEKAWPSKEGKLSREYKYLQQAASDLGLDKAVFNEGMLVDMGCGPLSILELIKGSAEKLAFDPLHNGYETLRNWDKSGVLYLEGRGEETIGFVKTAIPNDVFLITSVNGIDHYENPKQTLVNMNDMLSKGGLIALHYCINNASEGHPHPAHRIDLDVETMVGWGKELGLEVVQAKETHYGWRHQRAAAIIFRKTT
jgi:GT2 family glycosyltransferase